MTEASTNFLGTKEAKAWGLSFLSKDPSFRSATIEFKAISLQNSCSLTTSIASLISSFTFVEKDLIPSSS